MVAREELREVVEQIVEAADAWERAYHAWQRTVTERDRLRERMDRRITKATGGLGVARWQAACRRRFFHDVEDATTKARAIRAKAAVEAAVAERDRLLPDADATVLAARVALAEASKAVARYGTLGLYVIGQSAPELRRLARLPRT